MHVYVYVCMILSSMYASKSSTSVLYIPSHLSLSSLYLYIYVCFYVPIYFSVCHLYIHASSMDSTFSGKS